MAARAKSANRKAVDFAAPTIASLDVRALAYCYVLVHESAMLMWHPIGTREFHPCHLFLGTWLRAADRAVWLARRCSDAIVPAPLSLEEIGSFAF
jgi:hypothetical protein